MPANPDEIAETLLHEQIFGAIRGEPSLWPIDDRNPKLRAYGTYEARFRRGDKQILLWAIEHCARHGQLIPPWAAEELKSVLLRMAKGQCSWEDAFGRVRARGVNRQRIQSLSLMFDVWIRCQRKIKERQGAGENKDYNLMYEDVSRDLKEAGHKVGIDNVKKLFGLVQRYRKKHPGVITDEF
jgi:hypothetical protein